jgi:hypothetical protein
MPAVCLGEGSSILMATPATVSPISEVIEFFARGPSRQDIAAFHLSAAAQAYIRDLLAQHAAGGLTAEGERELDQMVLLDDIISLIRARVQGAPATT